MAQVFLSYERKDGARAKVIAEALEKAGHEVWWDRHIKGGTQYSKAIEEALGAAEVVVVLWSKNSIESGWVRDEAAVGRDSGRLVPATIDGTSPPLGFRQYHTIDLSGWKAGATSQGAVALLADVEAMASGGDRQAPSASLRVPLAARLRDAIQSKLTATKLLFAGLAILTLAFFIATPWEWTRHSSTTVAVAAADESSASQSYARDVLAQLGQLQATNPDAIQLVSGEASRNATFRLEVGGAADGPQSRASLVLVDSNGKIVLWSSTIERPTKEAPDLRQQLGYTVAHVLQCAAKARPDGRAILDAQALTLYLNGCAAYSDKTPDSLQSLVSHFRQLTTAKPGFADGWAKLLLVESDYAQMTHLPEAASIRATMPSDIAAARALDPNMPEAFLAEAMLLPEHAFGQRIGLLQQALQRSPDNAAVLSLLSEQLRVVGRMDESVSLAQRAVQVDPLSPAIRNSLIEKLIYAGKTEAAFSELRRLEQIWPGARNVRSARFVANLRYGDPNEALRSIRSGDSAIERNPYVESFLRARADPTPVNVDHAIADAESWYERAPTTIYHLVQVLGAFGREDQIISILTNWSHPDKVGYVVNGLFRPALRNVHRDPRMIAVAKRLGLLDYWRKSGEWPDFCFEPDLPYDCKAEAAKLAKAS